MNWNEKMETGRGKLENRKRKSREDTAERAVLCWCCDVAEKTKRLEKGSIFDSFPRTELLYKVTLTTEDSS